MRLTQILLAVAIGLTAIFGTGCSNEQLGRAEAMAQTTHSLLSEAEAHVAALEDQLATARKAAAESGDARIVAIVDQLQGAVTVAKTYLPALKTSAEQADLALATIRSTGQGDIPWWKVAIGIAVPLLLPLAKGIPVVGPVVGQLGELAWQIYTTRDQKNQQDVIEARARALSQTVAGIEAAKETMSPDQVAKLHAALATEQDKSVKGTIALVKATAVAALLMLGIGLAPAADLGLGPVPTNSTLVAPGPIGSTSPSSGAFTTLSATGAVTSTLADGSAPFVLTSTTKSTNLNSDLLDGTDWRAPGAIGAVTPAAANFTTVGGSGVATFSGTTDASAIGTANVVNAGGLSVAKKILWGGTATAAINADSINLDLVDTTASRTTQMLRINSSATAHTGYLLDVISSGSAATDLMFRLRANGTNLLSVVATGATTVSNIWTFSQTTDATASNSGTIVTSGGIGAAKNIISAQSIGAGLTSTPTAAATTVLSASTKSVQIFTGSTTQTVTLPAANAFGANSTPVLWIKNISSGTVTVQRAGSDTINSTASNVTSFTLAQWASCTLVSDGSTQWNRF